MRTLLSVGAACTLLPGMLLAQSVISAHSGTIHYFEGQVLLEGKPIKMTNSRFAEIKNDQELRTEDGRAEVLLTPGVFLRVGERSAVRMLSNSLNATKVELLTGSALVECAEILKDNAITFVYGSNSIELLKNGLYRIDTDPARIRVYKGQAIVKAPSGQLTLKQGKETALTSVLQAHGFKAKSAEDALYSWSANRSGYMAAANVSAANGIRTRGTSFLSSSWAYNPYFGGFTFIPFNGFYDSPFGYRYFSPGGVVYAFYPGGYSSGLRGYYGSGYNGGSSSNGSGNSTASSNTGPHGRSESSSGFQGGMSRASSAGASGGFSSGGGGMSGGSSSHGKR